MAVVSAAVMIAGCLLPWYGVGGGADLPARQLGAFSGSGILVFVAALATWALVALPYAAGDGPVAVDRWPVYLIIVVAAWVGLLYWALSFLGDTAPGLLPDRAPGVWVALVGTVGLSRAVYEVAQEPALR